MTSPSPTRRRTTRRRSIREPRRGGLPAAWRTALAAGVIFVALPASAAWRDYQRTEPPAPASTRGIVAAADDRDPVALPPADEVPGDEAPTVESAASAAPPPVDAASAVEPAAATDVADPCGEEAEACREALAKLRSDSLADIDLDIRVGGRPGNDYPCECRLEGETFVPRRFATTTFTWKAAGYCHKPLYFEHWNLERYGHSHGFVADSFLSAAHFFARLPALPYQMGVELPWECVYPLGYYRPGSCAPWTVPAVPVSARGFAVGAATATGIVFILP